jgi:hypothetical protein
MRTASLIFAVAVLAACGDSQPDRTSEESGPACVEQPFRAALHVDASDPRGSWATDYATGRDLAVRARPPERFTMDPSRPTELRNGEGKLVSFDGEISATGCVDMVRQVVYLGPNDLPDPNRPGG